MLSTGITHLLLLYWKYIAFSTQVYEYIFLLFDINFYVVDVLINVDVGNTSKTITRSENHLKDILAKENDPALLQMTASVIGNLALR